MNEPTIYALGFFDGVHIGHQALLAACRDLAADAGARAGAVTFSGHPDALVLGKAPALLNTQADRLRLLGERGMSRVVTLPFDRAMMEMPWQDFFTLLTTEYHAAGIVCGADFRFGCRGEGTADTLRRACAGLKMPCAVVPEQTLDGVAVSSTYIRGLLEAGRVEKANRFLGHPHILTGTVVSGQQLGRTMGVPTANLLPPPELLIPRFGVYACLARVDGKSWPAVTNIGTRPTVGGRHVTVEPWLLGFDGDLYGRELTLELHSFLRPEKKFPDLTALRAEIDKNAREVEKFFEKS